MVDIGPNLTELLKTVGGGIVTIVVLFCIFGNPFCRREK